MVSRSSEARIGDFAAVDQAERMTSRILKDPVASLWGAQPTYCAESLYSIDCRIEIFDGDVEVELLGVLTVGPARPDIRLDLLECQLPHMVRPADHHPVRVVLTHLHPQDLGIELSQAPRVCAVEHGLFEAADHGSIMHNPRQAVPVPLPLLLVLKCRRAVTRGRSRLGNWAACGSVTGTLHEFTTGRIGQGQKRRSQQR